MSVTTGKLSSGDLVGIPVNFVAIDAEKTLHSLMPTATGDRKVAPSSAFLQTSCK